MESNTSNDRLQRAEAGSVRTLFLFEALEGGFCPNVSLGYNPTNYRQDISKLYNFRFLRDKNQLILTIAPVARGRIGWEKT